MYIITHVRYIRTHKGASDTFIKINPSMVASFNLIHVFEQF
jgi:hypothetical protein